MSLPDSSMSAPEILKFVMDVDFYPYVSVAYRILLTVPVTVASAERSFSKLKLLKNYLRSTMSQERLNGLAMCSIEKDILDTIDVNTILDDIKKCPKKYLFMGSNGYDGVLFFIKLMNNDINSKLLQIYCYFGRLYFFLDNYQTC